MRKLFNNSRIIFVGSAGVVVIMAAVVVLLFRDQPLASPPLDDGQMPPMTREEFIPCDNDRDGDCDVDDYELVSGAMGRCVGEEGYNRLADQDRDGCVTEKDRMELFPVIPRR